MMGIMDKPITLLGYIYNLEKPEIYLIDLTQYRAEVRRSFTTATVRDESQVTPQGRHR